MIEQDGSVRSVTFFFPWRAVSGVPVLFGRMAAKLSERGDVRVNIVDYRGGAMSSVVGELPAVNHIEFIDGRPLTLPEDGVIVFQAMLPYNLPAEVTVPPGARVLYWTLYHMNLIPRLLPSRWAKDVQIRSPRLNRFVMNTLLSSLRDRLRATVEVMHREGSLLFMDRSTLSSTVQRLGIEVKEPRLLPVACGDVPPGDRRSGRATSGGELCFAWLGRLADFKIFMLLHVLEDLSRFSAEHRVPITMHIVGEGDESGRIRPQLLEHEYFSIRMRGTVVGPALEELLVGEVDLLWAMGTSALEAGKWGIPTVLLDACYGEVPSAYRYRWLHETRDFSLAELVSPDGISGGTWGVEDVVAVIRSDERYEEASVKEYSYCATHHAESTVARNLWRYLNEARFRYRDFGPGILRKGWVRRGWEGVRSASRWARGLDRNGLRVKQSPSHG